MQYQHFKLDILVVYVRVSPLKDLEERGYWKWWKIIKKTHIGLFILFGIQI